MQCPHCKARMHAEPCPLSRTRPHHYGGQRPGVSVHFRCDECDSEWIWVRGERIRQIDGMDYGGYWSQAQWMNRIRT